MPSKLWPLDPRFDPDLLAERDRRYVGQLTGRRRVAPRAASG
jgi:hypothetical protein